MLLSDKKADTIGILSSLLCVVHCLMLPVLVLGGLLHEEWALHAEWVDYLFILLAVGAVFFASRQADTYSLKVGMWLTVSWFSLSILLHDMFATALYSSMAASVVLVVLHSINFRQHQQQHQTKKVTA